MLDAIAIFHVMRTSSAEDKNRLAKKQQHAGMITSRDFSLGGKLPININNFSGLC